MLWAIVAGVVLASVLGLLVWSKFTPVRHVLSVLTKFSRRIPLLLLGGAAMWQAQLAVVVLSLAALLESVMMLMA
jgi:hypothetical protein